MGIEDNKDSSGTLGNYISQHSPSPCYFLCVAIKECLKEGNYEDFLFAWSTFQVS